MFYYLDPCFVKDDGHHVTHQTILHKLYGDDFCVLANKKLTITELPYKVIKCFQYNSWQYLSIKNNFEIFESEIVSLKDKLSENDTVFMYISDVLYIYTFINAILNFKVKSKFILNLFITGRYISVDRSYFKNIKSVLRDTREVRRRIGLYLMVEAERLQSEIKSLTGEELPILPMFHSLEFNRIKFGIEKDKKIVVSLLSASKHKGLEKFVDLIQFIHSTVPSLFDTITFRVRLFQESEENTKLIDMIKNKVEIQYGMVSYEEYQNLIFETDIMLLPYLSRNFYASTSGVFSDSIMNEIPVVATSNTWIGDQTIRYNVGEVFNEDSVQEFYFAFNKVLDNYSYYKNNVSAVKKSWKEYHSPESLKLILESLQNKDSGQINGNLENMLKKASKSHKKLHSLYLGRSIFRNNKKIQNKLILKTKIFIKKTIFN